MQHRLSRLDVLVETAGFRISLLHPFIWASPDGYVSCTCCGSGVRNKVPIFCLPVNEAGNCVADFCLEKDKQGTIREKQSHAYYYQLQLFVTDKPYCDFDTELECARVFKKSIIPKLLAKYFSVHGQVWCYCYKPQVGNMMVYASGFCSVKKFHQTFHMRRIPKQLICPICWNVIKNLKTNQW